MTVMSSSQSVEVTHNATFTTMVTGVGSNNFTYQWRHNGTIISGETGDTLIIRNVTTNDSGVYTCIVINKYGDSNSSSILLTVTGMHMLFNTNYMHTHIVAYLCTSVCTSDAPIN